MTYERFDMTQASQRGFTLVEVMIAAAVLAILTAIALPSYSAYVQRTARAEARAVMMEAGQFMQRFYIVNNAFDQTRTGAGVQLPATLQQSPRNGAARFQIGFQALTPDNFTLQAVPVGASADDPCGTLSITSTGVRGSTGLTAEDCWR